MSVLSVRNLFITTFVIGSLASCASFKPVAYSPNPATVTNPGEDFTRLIFMAKRWRPTKVDMQPTFAVLTYIHHSGVNTVALPFNEIAKIELLQDGDEFAVRASDSKGQPLYEYLAMDQNKAKEMANVLAALAQPKEKEAQPSAPPQARAM